MKNLASNLQFQLTPTSGFHAAVAAAGVEEGDEVIVSPYSMSASATSIVMTGAKPIFVDVESDCFCLNADQVELVQSLQTLRQ